MAYSGRIETGTSRTGAISPPAYPGGAWDYDTYNSTFIAGLTYSVAAKGAYSGNGTLVDPNLSLFDSNGTRIMYHDDIVQGVNRDATLSFKVNQTGVLTLGVGETGNNATGSYTLTLSAGFASNSNDRVTGTAYGDAINGMAGNDFLNGAGGNDRLFGGDGADTLWGGAGADILFGQTGADVLRGHAGNDALYSGYGADDLIGGTGADRFIFMSHTDSNRAFGVDVITAGDGAAAFEGVGVAGGDRIDLSQIDANANLAGNQAFVWSASRTAGTLSLSDVNGNTVVNGHVNNDGVVDFVLIIADGAIAASRYTSDEFLL